MGGWYECARATRGAQSHCTYQCSLKSLIRCHWPLWPMHRPGIHSICTQGGQTKGLCHLKNRCKAVEKYLLQFNQLVMKQGFLHQVYITNDVESHQLVLPKECQQVMLDMLHNDHGHQGLNCTLALVRERFYWSMIYQDVTEYVTNCHWCHVTKDHYTGPHTQQGLLVANNYLDLLCIDFLKIDPSEHGKKCVSVDWCLHQVQSGLYYQQSEGT